MKPFTLEDYWLQQLRSGVLKWEELEKSIAEGKHPTNAELAALVINHGVPPGGEMAVYFWKRLNGEIKPPHGNARPSSDQSDEMIRLMYDVELMKLQDLKSRDPTEYRRRYAPRPVATGIIPPSPAPFTVAMEVVKEKLGLRGTERIRKLVHSKEEEKEEE